MKYEKSCGSIVIYEGKVLLVKHNAGHWDFPKGHVESGETEEETAIREVKEETNIDIEVDPNYRYTTSYSPKVGVMKDVIYFLGTPKTFNIVYQQEEVSDAKFIPISEAINTITYNNSKEILKKLALKLDKC